MRDLQSSINWSAEQLRTINTTSAADRERATRMYADYQRAFADRFNRFLTPEQQRSWATLVGDPYRFQPIFTSGLPGGSTTSTPGTTATGSNPGAGPGGTTGTPPKR